MNIQQYKPVIRVLLSLLLLYILCFVKIHIGVGVDLKITGNWSPRLRRRNNPTWETRYTLYTLYPVNRQKNKPSDT